MRHYYKMLYIPRNHPFYCMSSGGGIGEHRLVMAEHLGRPLSGREIVHHKDNNPKNNNLDNLYLTNWRDHQVITKRDALRCGLCKASKHLLNIRKELEEIEKLHEKLLRDI